MKFLFAILASVAVGTAQGECMDTPGWDDGFGGGCDSVEMTGLCTNGAVTANMVSRQHFVNNPQDNCLACGKTCDGGGAADSTSWTTAIALDGDTVFKCKGDDRCLTNTIGTRNQWRTTTKPSDLTFAANDVLTTTDGRFDIDETKMVFSSTSGGVTNTFPNECVC